MAKTNTKAHVACYILKRSGPLTRIELMKRVHVLEGKPGAFKPTSNISYFTPKIVVAEFDPTQFTQGETPDDIRRERQWYNNNVQRLLERNRSSWLQKGIIKVVGKTKNGTFAYDVTDEGHVLADSYVR